MKAFKWFIVLCFILGVGFIAAAFVYGADLDEIIDIFDDSDQYSEVKTYTFNQQVDKLVIDVEERHIEFRYSDVSHVTIDYREHENDTWTFDVDDDVMIIEQEKTSRWRFLQFGFTPRMYKEVVVYLPLDTTYFFSVSTDVGDITLEFDTIINAEEVVLNSNTGSISLKNVNILDELIVSSDTGSIDLEDVTGDSLRVRLSTGDLDAKSFSFNTVDIETSTGDVHLESGIVQDDLSVSVSTGSIDIDLVSANDYNLVSSTGNVSLETDEVEKLYFDLRVSVGNITVYGASQGTSHVTQSSTTQTVLVKVRTSTGNITITTS